MKRNMLPHLVQLTTDFWVDERRLYNIHISSTDQKIRFNVEGQVWTTTPDQLTPAMRQRLGL